MLYIAAHRPIFMKSSSILDKSKMAIIYGYGCSGKRKKGNQVKIIGKENIVKESLVKALIKENFIIKSQKGNFVLRLRNSAAVMLLALLTAVFTACSGDDSGGGNGGATNRPPQFSKGSYTVTDSGITAGTAITTVSAVDVEGDELAYSFSSQIELKTPDTQLVLFTIDVNSGAITVATDKSLEFGATYILTAQVSDNSASDLATITVTTAAAAEFINQPPVFTQDSYSATVTDIAAGAAIMTISAADADSDTMTYSIVLQMKLGEETMLDLFAVDVNSGAITVAADKSLELGATYLLTVQVSDSHGTSSTATVVVSTMIEVINTIPTILTEGKPILDKDHAKRATVRIEVAAAADRFQQTITVNWVPIALQITNIEPYSDPTEGSVTVHWPALEGASGYIVKLFNAEMRLVREESITDSARGGKSHTFALSDNSMIYLSATAINGNNEQSLSHVLGPIDPQTYTVASSPTSPTALNENQTLYSLLQPALYDDDLSTSNILVQLAGAAPPVTLTLDRQSHLEYHFLQLGIQSQISNDTASTTYSNALKLNYLKASNFYPATARHIIAIPTDSVAASSSYSVVVAADNLLLGLNPELENIVSVPVLRRSFTAATEAIAEGAADPGPVSDPTKVWLTLDDPATSGEDESATTDSGKTRCESDITDASNEGRVVCSKNVPHTLVYAPEADSLFYCGAGLRYITKSAANIEQCYAFRADDLDDPQRFERAAFHSGNPLTPISENHGNSLLNSSDVEIAYDETEEIYTKINHYGLSRHSSDAVKFSIYATYTIPETAPPQEMDRQWIIEELVRSIEVNRYWLRAPVKPVRTIRLKQVQEADEVTETDDDYNDDGLADFVFDFFTENWHTDVDADFSADLLRGRVVRTCADDPGLDEAVGGIARPYRSYLKARTLAREEVPNTAEGRPYINEDYNLLQAVDLDDLLHTYMIFSNGNNLTSSTLHTALALNSLRSDDEVSEEENLFNIFQNDLVLAREGDVDEKQRNHWFYCGAANMRDSELAQNAVVSTKNSPNDNDAVENVALILRNELGTSIAVHPQDRRRVLMGTRSGKVYDILIKKASLFPGVKGDQVAQLTDFSAYSDYSAQFLDDSKNAVVLNVYEIEDNSITNVLVDKQNPGSAWAITTQGVYSFPLSP